MLRNPERPRKGLRPWRRGSLSLRAVVDRQTGFITTNYSASNDHPLWCVRDSLQRLIGDLQHELALLPQSHR
jgi:hypothetical protein